MLVSARHFRSSGCRTCIARKVKCDETRPACLRCTRANRQCGQYRDQHDLIFRPQQIQPPIEPSWEQLAIPFFLHNHTIPAARGRPGHLDFLSELYGKSGSSGQCFNQALLAVSTGSLARNRHDVELNNKALRVYGKALASLRVALSDDELAQLNTTVAAMLLLSRFETIHGDESSKSGAHFCAGIELMKVRKPEHINTMTGKIFHFMRLELAMRNMCSLESTTLLEPVTPLASPYTMRSFSDLVLQAETACLELWAATRNYDRNNAVEAHEDHVEAKIHQALQLEHRLQDFQTTVDSVWKYSTVTYSASGPTPPLPTPNDAYIFSDIQLAAQWMDLWCADIRLKDTLAASLTASYNPSTRSAVIKSLSNATSSIDKICASVPFMLGELDANGCPRTHGDVLVGPAPMVLAPVLFIAGTSYPVQEAQKAWICARLVQIGCQRGIGQAFVFEKQIRRGM